MGFKSDYTAVNKKRKMEFIGGIFVKNLIQNDS